MNTVFFRECYETIYHIFSSLYSTREIENLCFQRVDSTLVSEACDCLQQGISCGNLYGKKKMMKYTINFDGMFASFATIHSGDRESNESVVLP